MSFGYPRARGFVCFYCPGGKLDKFPVSRIVVQISIHVIDANGQGVKGKVVGMILMRSKLGSVSSRESRGGEWGMDLESL